MKAALLIAIRLAALTAIYFICFAVVSGLLIAPPPEQSAPDQAGSTLAALWAVSFLHTVVLVYVVLRSRWAGWKLVITIFIVFYGATTLLTQIETAFFVTRLPPGILPRLFLAGAIIAAIFAPLAVLILGKWRPGFPEARGASRLDLSAGEWVVRLSVIVIAYIVIYFTFGYFIVWKNEAVLAYYSGSDPGSLFAQMRSVVRDMPLLLPLQAVRAILWTAIALPVIRMMRGPWWEAALAVALLFAVVNSQLLLPNPYMPREVRMAHLLETTTSNFLFGWLVVLVLCRWRRSESEPARL